MKKLAFFFAMFSIAWTGFAQTTGSGVVLQTDSPYAFTPTTVDSTAVFEVELTNTVGVAQTVYFGGLEAPFSIDPATPQEVPANSSINLSISFNPTEIGSFEDELEVLGDVFGSANLALSGQGIQVILDWTPADLSFETTAIGQQSSATVTVTSSGDGAGTISDVVFSNSIFSLDEDNSTLSIDEGTSGDLTFLFSPTGAGVFNETVELYTNDPNNSVITIPLTATGISEVSGEVCDVTWSLADSPFTLVGDVTVPDGCTLTIEPGVVVFGNNYRMTINGSLISNGSVENIVEYHDIRFYAENALVDISHIESLGGITVDTDSINTAASVPYGTGYYDVYHDDFESYDAGTNGLFSCDNYESGNDYTSSSTNGNNGCIEFYVESSETYSHSGTKSFRWRSYEYDARIYYEPIISVPATGEYYLSFGHKVAYRERNDTFFAYYRVNNGSWVEFYDAPRGDYENYGETSSQLDQIIGVQIYLSAGDEVEIYFDHYIGSTSSCYDNQRSHIDDIRLTRLVNDPSLIYTTEGNWDFNTEFYDDGWDVGCDDCYSYEVYAGGTEYVEFRTRGCSTCGNDEWLQSPEFTVTETGLLQFEWQEYIPGAYYYWRPRVQVSINGGTYNDVYLWDLSYCESYIYDDYSSWNPRIATLGDVSSGDTFRIRLNPFQNQGNSYDFYIRYKDLNFFTVPIGTVENFLITETETTGNMDFDSCIFLNPVTNVNLSDLNLNVASSSEVDFESCDIQNLIVTDTDSIAIVNSTIHALAIHRGSADGPSEFLIQNSIADSANMTNAENMVVSSSQISNFVAQWGSLQTYSELAISQSSFSKVVIVGWFNTIVNHTDILNSDGAGLLVDLGTEGSLDMDFCKVIGSAGKGVDVNLSNGEIYIDNSIIAENGGAGVESAAGVINYTTIANNASGWANSSGGNNLNRFISNSIVSSSNAISSAATSYVSTVSFPQFQEGSYMLEPYSPCVDAAMPWNTDQNMPYGMGGLRADMGAYGGPNNAGWGGSPAPDGAATLQAASDSPQDQGYVLGLTFDASAFDNSIITDNISHYAVWRHYDPTGESIASLDDGNWELLGTMPAQGFSGYAYQAEALGNTNDFGSFTSCYTVVAHTDNEDVYWYSNVMCGEAVDNLAPENPDLNGLVLETGEAQLSWPTPAEEDYAYTEIFSDAGFSAEVGADTLVVDNTVLAGNSYTYTAVHYDVNGNASDAVSLTLDISAGLDVINLNAGWNLISIDRSLSDGDIETLFSGLQSNNLQYVTGFQNGVQFYDPNGLSFLNTMSSVDNGYGYWVKVAEDDVLEVGGSSLPVNYRPELNAGWNLIGYPNAEDSDPADYFDDLIAEDNLVYVTGFNQGSQVFDPNGLAFLNTLQELENGFGYWVKTLVGEDLNGLATTDTKRNPSYMVLNGLSSLTAAGETVDVLNASGGVIAQMEILEGGFLMTTAVFGADPSDANAFGLELGETLSFAFNGRLADQTIEWQGGMEHRALNLTFGDAAEALTLAPNPAQDQTWLTFQLDRDAAVSVQVTDALGRVVMQQPLGTLTQGDQQHALSLLGMAPGVYEVAVMSDGSVAATARLLMQK